MHKPPRVKSRKRNVRAIEQLFLDFQTEVYICVPKKIAIFGKTNIPVNYVVVETLAQPGTRALLNTCVVLMMIPFIMPSK